VHRGGDQTLLFDIEFCKMTLFSVLILVAFVYIAACAAQNLRTEVTFGDTRAKHALQFLANQIKHHQPRKFEKAHAEAMKNKNILSSDKNALGYLESSTIGSGYFLQSFHPNSDCSGETVFEYGQKLLSSSLANGEFRKMTCDHADVDNGVLVRYATCDDNTCVTGTNNFSKRAPKCEFPQVDGDQNYPTAKMFAKRAARCSADLHVFNNQPSLQVRRWYMNNCNNAEPDEFFSFRLGACFAVVKSNLYDENDEPPPISPYQNLDGFDYSENGNGNIVDFAYFKLDNCHEAGNAEFSEYTDPDCLNLVNRGKVQVSNVFPGFNSCETQGQDTNDDAGVGPPCPWCNGQSGVTFWGGSVYTSTVCVRHTSRFETFTQAD
jgi:hypothetical protein